MYTAEEMNAIAPDHVLTWMKLKTYGTPDPDDDANPTRARSNSLKYWKKALSFSIPNRHLGWNEIRGEGNPTRCSMANDLIKRVKQKEARKQGALSRT